MSVFFKFVIVVLFCTMLGSTGCGAREWGRKNANSDDPALQEHSVSVDNESRVYSIFIPDKLTNPAPVIFAFHGGAGSAQNIARQTGFNALARREGFVVVYPQGTGRIATWNAGKCCGTAQKKNIDDLAYIREVMKDVSSLAPVDRGRVFATGMSNGAMMSFRLACEMPDVFRAVAPVAGRMVVAQDCQPGRSVSLAIFNALDDFNVPFDGGVPTKGIQAKFKSGVSYPSVKETLGVWVKNNKCEGKPQLQKQEKYEVLEYHCAGDNRIKLYTLYEGGHSWPGGVKGYSKGDTPTQALSAIEEMWEFFKNIR